jgi:hypothetical protein
MDTHPIPLVCIDKIDVLAFNKDGSVNMMIIAAGYLGDTDETKNRLCEKINNYLSMFNSEDFEEQHGKISYDQLTITLSPTLTPHPNIVAFIQGLANDLSEDDIKFLLKEK